MVVASVASLKASLSELLAGVKAGEEVVITERGRPVARIVRYEPGGDELDDLVRRGQMRRPRSRLPIGFWKRTRPSDPEGRLLQTLLEERDASR
jgi:prevent-host-death family protein